MFENEWMRRILGPTKEEGTEEWRK